MPRGTARHACCRPGAGGPRHHLTFVVLAGRVVEGEPQRDDGGDFQNDQRHVLQGLPHELQEGFWLLWRYKVLPKNLLSLLQVWSGAWQTCGQSAEVGLGVLGRHTCPGITPRGAAVWQGESEKEREAKTRQEAGRNPSGACAQCWLRPRRSELVCWSWRTRGPISTLIDKLTHHRV